MQRRAFLSSLAALPLLRDLFTQPRIEPKMTVDGLWDFPTDSEDCPSSYNATPTCHMWFDPSMRGIPAIDDIVQINGSTMKASFTSYDSRLYNDFIGVTA